MSTVILSVMVSLDGFFQGPREGWEKIDWHRADDEWEAPAIELLHGAEMLLFGRRTYEGFAQYWPHQQASRPQRRLDARLAAPSRRL
jgi:dihydrofolate reductase